MHDLRFIRSHPDLFDQGLLRRGLSPLSQEILDQDARHRSTLTELQHLQSQRNTLAKQFGEAKKKGQDTTELAQQADEIKKKIAELEVTSEELYTALSLFLASIPNIPAEDVPNGTDETGNIEVRRFGTPRSFSFSPKPHYELGEALGLMDFERAAKLSGSRFVVLYGHLARLERALATFMIDIHTNHFGYSEVYSPVLVHEKAMFGTGNLPKFKEDLFYTNSGHYLIPTAEAALTNLVSEEIIPASELPLRFTAYTPCFRAEAGAAGRDTRGMIRQHQFGKVELVTIATPEQSAQEHERMTQAAEEILKRLELPYRVILLCSGDMGFASQKTYDLEVWLPSQNMYREISSCSNCGDFQARRMNARYRPHTHEGEHKSSPQFVHTLNGSGVAVGRTMVAILENYQEEDGSIRIPSALIPYMGGIEVIRK